ncbi:MAG: hypothetical protein IKQ84_06500 [Spirochaetaceae bacterium]|nr:hypothetical protein [Spirochaetaceae bacterium]
MKTFKRYLTTILITTYAGVFFLRIFHYGFIYEKPSEIILGFAPTFFITLALIAICSFFQWPLLTAFEKTIEKGKRNPDSITQDDIDFCLKAYRNYDLIIIIAHVIGFLLGAGSTAIISSAKGIAPFNPITFTLIEMQSVATGFMCYTVNYVLVKRIYMAGQMRQIGIKLSENLSRVQNVAMWASVDASIINMMTVPYGIILNSRTDGYNTFLIYCLIGWVTSLVEFFIVFKVITKTIQRNEKTISNNLMAETQHLADATKQNAENSQNQTAAVKEIVATMHDSTELANNIGEKIKQVTSLAEKSRDAVLSGSQALQNNVQELLNIKNTNILTIDGIKELNSKINGIWDIVSIINNVADQTKIIAFNAELEASSSGEAGKNFHIVATEIRRLSDNIIDSIKEIREIIAEIQKASDTLILDSEKGTAQIDSGCESARSLESGFESIMESSKATASSSHEILDTVNQLTSASEQIFITLQQIAQGIESFSKSTSNISTASENVKDIASLL